MNLLFVKDSKFLSQIILCYHRDEEVQHFGVSFIFSPAWRATYALKLSLSETLLSLTRTSLKDLAKNFSLYFSICPGPKFQFPIVKLQHGA